MSEIRHDETLGTDVFDLFLVLAQDSFMNDLKKTKTERSMLLLLLLLKR
jgi:hypothetical protein